MPVTRREHLDWCKRRALEYLDRGQDPASAVASMGSDLAKHPMTMNLAGNMALNAAGILAAMEGAGAVRRWIEGFQ